MIIEVLNRFFLVCIAILGVGNFENWMISANVNGRVCTTPQCIALSQIYSDNLNKMISPCHNFFGYACGRWGEANLKPQYYDIWKVEEILQQKSYTQLQSILEDPHTRPILKFEQAKALYRSCLNIPQMGQVVPSLLKTVMSNVGHWPMFFSKNEKLPKDLNWWDIDNMYIQRTGESALYDIVLRASEANNNKIRIVLKHMTSPYGMLQRTETWVSGSGQRNHYKNFLTTIIRTVGPHKLPFIGGSLANDLSDVMRFRDDLLKILRSLHRPLFVETTIGNFQAAYNRHVTKHENTKINWLNVYRSVYVGANDPYGAPVQHSTPIQIVQGYIYDLATLLAKTPKHVIVNHIHLYFAERHTHLNAAMTKELEKSYNFQNGVLNGFKRRLVPRAKWCIENHNMVNVLGLMYSQAILSDPARNEVQKLIDDAKSIMTQQIMESPWVGQKAKDVSMQKLKLISNTIGHPPWYDAPELRGESDPFDVDPLEPDAYYVLDKNRLYISSSFLQLPMYGHQLPFPATYGATVSIFGHELQHAFDPNGLYYHDNDTTHTWPNKMYQEFHKRTKCFKEQYADFRNKHIKEYKMHVGPNHPSTLDEDIADVMGLKIAYRGFINKMKEHSGTCKTLPGFEKSSCQALFFLAFANTFCAASSAEGDKYALQIDTHSLPRIRLNGAVANMEEFSVAFGCKPTDPLNIKKRCDIWKN